MSVLPSIVLMNNQNDGIFFQNILAVDIYIAYEIVQGSITKDLLLEF